MQHVLVSDVSIALQYPTLASSLAEPDPEKAAVNLVLKAVYSVLVSSPWA